jgi:RNA polymerase primary sigma factor
VLWLRFGLDRDGEERTLADIARELGLSRDRVRQIEAEAFTRLRRVPRLHALFADYLN